MKRIGIKYEGKKLKELIWNFKRIGTEFEVERKKNNHQHQTRDVFNLCVTLLCKGHLIIFLCYLKLFRKK